MQVDAAAARVRDNILTSAEAEGLTYQAYWLSATLALGAFLKVSTYHQCTPKQSIALSIQVGIIVRRPALALRKMFNLIATFECPKINA